MAAAYPVPCSLTGPQRHFHGFAAGRPRLPSKDPEVPTDEHF